MTEYGKTYYSQGGEVTASNEPGDRLREKILALELQIHHGVPRDEIIIERDLFPATPKGQWYYEQVQASKPCEMIVEESGSSRVICGEPSIAVIEYDVPILTIREFSFVCSWEHLEEIRDAVCKESSFYNEEDGIVGINGWVRA